MNADALDAAQHRGKIDRDNFDALDGRARQPAMVFQGQRDAPAGKLHAS